MLDTVASQFILEIRQSIPGVVEVPRTYEIWGHEREQTFERPGRASGCDDAEGSTCARLLVQEWDQ